MVSSPSRKRIIVCCDGTWQNSDNGYAKSNNIKSKSSLQVPSNFQIIYYQSGVGSRSGIIDKLFGGAFGTGISENIREAYAFICANYVDGDEIVLLGFSRGAFTARSIGGMISDLGLLTRQGHEYFYPIFKDMQNWSNGKYDDPFPAIPFTNKPKGEDAASIYRDRLVEKGYSRIKGNDGQGNLIRVLAIGSLGQFQFYNTHLSKKIQHGFHALALDEARDLRQVWFPGSHANIGGGWPDQGVANTTLAWMMDQLSSVGCEFRTDALERAFETTVRYYTNQEPESVSRHRKHMSSSWAEKSIYESNKPVRPWSLHYIQSATGPLYNLVGSVCRAPGMYKKIDPKNGRPLPEYLEDTNERIHPSVRVRLACEGLGLNDSGVWHCPSLLKYWRPRRVSGQFFDPVSRTAEWGPTRHRKQAGTTANQPEHTGSTSNAAVVSAESLSMLSQDPSERWVWEYVGPDITAPAVRTMVEENLGPFEQRLLQLAAGKVHVYKYAEKQDVNEFKALHIRGFRKMMKRLHRQWERKAARGARRKDGSQRTG
ncbi:hypothetical protein F5Y09DRAFT_331155 [Xylaria sp. FL1042]|nr:hypothetical protein F5Y09DRAFT_331155 [Xylaria sp. FL1042]